MVADICLVSVFEDLMVVYCVKIGASVLSYAYYWNQVIIINKYQKKLRNQRIAKITALNYAVEFLYLMSALYMLLALVN